MRPAREPLFTIRTQPLGELSPKFRENARPDRLPHASHSVKEERQIMVGQQDAGQYLTRHIKVPQVRARVSPADGTLARFVQRPRVFCPLGVLDVQLSARGKSLAGSSVSCRQDTVEHIEAARDRFDEIFGRADAH